jgi:CBS domain containing-hemolysin-like protein
VVAIDVNDTIDDLKLAFIESGHSKIIIYRDSIDEVIGYTHSQELFKKPKTIQDILTPIIIVPETMPANELLIQFITERKSLSLVVDEFGGTAGIVSIEDIIEEIFGDIQDEHDDEDWIEQKLNEHTYLFSARHEIDYLNEKYKWAIPTGDYDTLSGYILSITEDIPSSGEVIKAYPFTFTIMAMRENRIDNVKLAVSEENED